MKVKFSFEYYKNQRGSQRFPNGSVLLSPGEYQWWFVGDEIFVNLEWNDAIFQYKTHDGIITPSLRKNPKDATLWLFTMNPDGGMRAPSCFCIAAGDIL